MSPGLLVVQHQETCPPGRVGDWFADAGIDLDVRRPYAGDELPGDLSAMTDCSSSVARWAAGTTRWRRGSRRCVS